MIDIGKTLKEERERLGIKIEDVANGTLIRPYYLEEIEENHFHEYDGFTASYIRRYANFLGIDASPIVESYQEMFKGSEVVLKPRKKNKAYIFVIIVVLLVISGFLYFRFAKNKSVQPSTPTTENPSNPPQETPSENTQPPINETPQTPTIEQGIHIVLKGSGLCWLGVTIDGKYSQTFIHKGETLEFKGKDYITIRYGFAPNVSLIKNGKDLGVVSKTEKVIEITYKP